MSNRLIHENSPYLQQHAHNPVDWYPWGEEAFKKARINNRIIFLSIGYSSCHWCHVMEHEVFEDKAIAAYLNNHFVSIKVDREERPDIDKHFQSVHRLINQRPGGWPLSIFMTPDMKPFFAGTYIPPKRKYNMMGFLELIEVIEKKWIKAPKDIIKNANEIKRFLEPKDSTTKATKLNLSLIDKTITQIKENYDARRGGFSKAPKFPHTSTINLLQDIYRLTNNEKALDMMEATLKNMAKGGIYDLVDGGFCRYSTDEAWLVPHFEKMTYDNALLCENYLKAYNITNETFYIQIAKEIILFMKEKMMENHLFYSASDADSQVEEGKYFIYSYDEIIKALESAGYKQSEIKDISKTLGITEKGNFEGKNIIRNETLGEYPWWSDIRTLLKKLRKSKPYPFIDKKIITAWNAMMIKSLFIASDIDKIYLDDAIKSLHALLDLMLKEKDLYHSVLIHKKPVIKGFLEDYAYLCDTLLQAYKSTLDKKWLLIAQKIAELAIDRFFDNGKWYFSKEEFITQADISDSSYPSSAAIMTTSLLTLGSLLDIRYRDIAFKTLEYNSIKIMTYPQWHATFTTAAVRYLKEDIVIHSTQNNLLKIKDMKKEIPYPYILLKVEIEPNIVVCDQHSCFAKCKDLSELKKVLGDY